MSEAPARPRPVALPGIGEADATKREAAEREVEQAEIERCAKSLVGMMLDLQAAKSEAEAAHIARAIDVSFEQLSDRGHWFRTNVSQRVAAILGELAGAAECDLPATDPANVEPESFSEAPNDGTA